MWRKQNHKNRKETMNPFISNKLYCKKSNIPNSGYGIFTNDDIKKGDVIEVSRFIEIDFKLYNYVDGNILSVLYNFPKDNPKYLAIVLGYGSLYNSSLNDISNNVDWITNEDDKVFIYFAKTDINKNEELYIYYNNYEFNNNK